MKGNKRLPGDLLGRWTRLVEGLETITQGRWEEGFHIDMSDLVVLNAYLTEDAEFEKWHGSWNTEHDALHTTIATQAAELKELITMINQAVPDATVVFANDVSTAKIPNEGLVDYVRWNVVVEKWDEQLGRIADIAERINARAARDITEAERRMQ